MDFDLVILNGTVHSAHGSEAADIGVRGGKIAEVVPAGLLRGRGAGRVIEAGGLDVIPGCIDPHVHLDLRISDTITTCDDFESGSRAAACGGITTIIDFATPEPGQMLVEAHEAWQRKAEGRSIVDYAWHMCITDDKHLAQIPHMFRLGIPTFKEFMIYEERSLRSDDGRILETLKLMQRHGGMLLLHAESPEVLAHLIAEHNDHELMTLHGAKLHAMTRPDYVEAEAVQRAILWSEVTGGALYLVHMSTARSADLIQAARAKGVNVRGETCPQYLVLDDGVFDREDGHLFASCPQVKKRSDSARLWSALPQVGTNNETLSTVGTDTCSFTRAQKDTWDRNFKRIPMGLPGLDTMLPLMYTHGVQAGRLTMNQMVALCSTNAASLMGLGERKGTIAVGYDADVVVLDPAYRRVVEPRSLQSRCDWSPYEGMELAGFAKTTIVRGRVVVDEYEVVTSAAGHGVYLERKAGGGYDARGDGERVRTRKEC